METSRAHKIEDLPERLNPASVTRIGTSSFKVMHKLWRGKTLCVEASEIRVWSAQDEATGAIAAVPIPDWLRATLTGSIEGERQ